MSLGAAVMFPDRHLLFLGLRFESRILTFASLIAFELPPLYLYLSSIESSKFHLGNTFSARNFKFSYLIWSIPFQTFVPGIQTLNNMQVRESRRFWLETRAIGKKRGWVDCVLDVKDLSWCSKPLFLSFFSCARNRTREKDTKIARNIPLSTFGSNSRSLNCLTSNRNQVQNIF